MTLPLIGFRRTTERAVRHPLVWMARELSIDAQSGQTGTFLRSTTKSVADSFAVNRTVNHSQPAWWTNGGTAALDAGASESLAWPLNVIPQSMGGLVKFVENGAVASSGAPILCLCGSTFTAPCLYVDASAGGKYQITHNSGVSTVVATLAAAPTSGQTVELRWQLNSTGSVQIWQSINGAAETTPGASGTLALAATWNGSPPTFFLNAKAVSAYGVSRFVGAVVMLGTPTQAQLRQVIA